MDAGIPAALNLAIKMPVHPHANRLIINANYFFKMHSLMFFEQFVSNPATMWCSYIETPARL